jgi:hypothetical protein
MRQLLAHERMGEIKRNTGETTRDGKKMKDVCSSKKRSLYENEK